MLRKNQNASNAGYPEELKRVLNMANAQKSRSDLSEWPLLERGPTPLWNMPGLARQLNVGRISIKDESARSKLGSFKVLGAPIALVRLINRLFPDQPMTPKDLFSGTHRGRLANTTVISATDGNHGRALAAAAQSLGCPCVIVLHAHVSDEREAAIAAYGASIVRISGDYDESVEEASRLAAENGWYVVSDTSYEGYEEIPRDVMQGYATIAAEAIEQAQVQTETVQQACPFSHVFLQGGVGGLAAGIASYFWEAYGEHRPKFFVVEPEQANCLFQSALLSRPAQATGTVDSIMAGLACGQTSPLAWRFLQQSIDYFMTVADTSAIAAMRKVAAGEHGDVPIVGGESGVAGLAGLAWLTRDPSVAARAGLNAHSSVLLVNTEGATAPSIYRDIVGEDSQAVLGRQIALRDGAR
jgi:diaminopropionate ammonia-lyase